MPGDLGSGARASSKSWPSQCLSGRSVQCWIVPTPPTVPRPPRLLAREVGPATVVLLAVAYGILWLLARPASVSAGSYFGQWCGAESILLLSIALVLISSLPWVEVWFDGIDRAAIWHRRVAMLGLLLLLPHILLSSGNGASTFPAKPSTAVVGRTRSDPRRHRSARAVGAGGLGDHSTVAGRRAASTAAADHHRPRPARHPPFRRIVGGYERWRLLHRTTGVFVALGFIHGIMDGTPFNAAPILRWTFIAIGGIGLAFYVYRETDRSLLPVPARLPSRRRPRESTAAWSRCP